VDVHLCDINNREGGESAMRGVTYVHHNLALLPLTKAGERFWTVNVEDTRTALQAVRAAGVKMFCQISSSAIFDSYVKPTINALELVGSRL
jgi:nucleoside-diphosphate-sugar epimerase